MNSESLFPKRFIAKHLPEADMELTPEAIFLTDKIGNEERAEQIPCDLMLGCERSIIDDLYRCVPGECFWITHSPDTLYPIK